ncbi:hypothetical protein PPHE_b0184 [Pseudoalteromonas phenolica O-BC30]|nr:hypothetical protein [Pseudoalteromonas phenolica O-BC30]
MQRIHALTLLINCLFSGEIEGVGELSVGFVVEQYDIDI